MHRRSSKLLWQAGVHIKPASSYATGAKMKHWPEQEIPAKFSFTSEQRFRIKGIPRDTGRIPRNFVLGVLYRNQPADVQSLWDACCEDPGIVLDSKRHLREVLQQARDEGFVYFEKEDGQWQCLLTRERYDEVKSLVEAQGDGVHAIEASPSLTGEAATKTKESSEVFTRMTLKEKEDHLSKLREQVSQTSNRVRTHSRNELDYLPYTDLNGKVCFMWWYGRKEGLSTEKRIPAPPAAPVLSK